MSAAPDGWFVIVLEGCDGSGTTTQVPRLARHLRRLGYAVATRAQPSGGPIGRLLRRFLAGGLALDPATQALLFAADRLHLRLRLRGRPGAFVTRWPWWRAAKRPLGRVLLLDRDVLSSLVYQGQTLPRDWLLALNRHSPPPDLLLYFDVSPQVAAGRRQKRGERAQAFDAAATQAQVIEAYRRQMAMGGCAAKASAWVAADRPVHEVTFALCQVTEAALAEVAMKRGARPPAAAG